MDFQQQQQQQMAENDMENFTSVAIIGCYIGYMFRIVARKSVHKGHA